MAFSSKEKIIDYLSKILNRFKLSDIEAIAEEYFEMSPTALEKEIRKRKLRRSKKNMMQVLMLKIKNNKWKPSDVIAAAFDLELSYVIKYSHQFLWTANKFLGDSGQEILNLEESIRATIRNDKRDATVMVRESGDFFWISISMKNLKKLGIYGKPQYIVLSKGGKYFFTKDKRAESVIQFVTDTLGYESQQQKNLTGRFLRTLLKFLLRKENVDLNNRPVFQAGEAVPTEVGLDFTQKKHFIDFYNKCVDNDDDINLESYTFTSKNSGWMGDDNPALRDMQFTSSITLSGNVAKIIRQLPISSIVEPPLPNYLINFSVHGKNVVSVKPPLPFRQLE